MTIEDKIGKMKNRIEPENMPSDELLADLLDFAGRKIINTRYPFRDDITEVPSRWEPLQIDIAVEIYSKMGAEGQTSHSENGIARAYENAGVSHSKLDEITPYVGVI